jgi:taurine dioxygenase
MSRDNINFRALSPFGAEANEIKITEIDDKDLVSLKHVIASNGLLVFRKQAVSDADFVAFLSRLGPMTFTAGEIPVPHQPDLNVVSNVGRDRPPRSVFHTDTSYIDRPPAFTALLALRHRDRRSSADRAVALPAFNSSSSALPSQVATE